MKRKIKDELAQMKVPELEKRVVEYKTKLAALSVERYTKQSKNLRERKNLRKEIAFMRTKIREKELSHE